MNRQMQETPAGMHAMPYTEGETEKAVPMTSKDSLKDVAADLREDARQIRLTREIAARMEPQPTMRGRFLDEIFSAYADRLDAVAKPEAVYNMAAMREALEFADRQLRMATEDDRYGEDLVYLVGCMRTVAAACRAALAEPPRNCDVGTAEEQTVRFDAFVRDRRGDLNCTGKCPAHNGVDFGVVNCVLQWAQTPSQQRNGQGSHREALLGKWLNGDNYEYEFAYCSECGHMQWANWDTHSQAREKISDFPKEYKFCPNCGARMVEGAYINGRGKKKYGGK